MMKTWYDDLNKNERKKFYNKVEKFLKNDEELIEKIAKEGLANWHNQFAHGEVQLNVETLEVVGWSNIGGSSQENPINPYIGLLRFNQNHDWEDAGCDSCDDEDCTKEQKEDCISEQAQLWVENELNVDEILRSLHYDLFLDEYQDKSMYGGF